MSALLLRLGAIAIGVALLTGLLTPSIASSTAVSGNVVPSSCLAAPLNGSAELDFLAAGTNLSLSDDIPFCLSASVTVIGNWTASVPTAATVLLANTSYFGWPTPSSYSYSGTFNLTEFPGSYDLVFDADQSGGVATITSSVELLFDRTTVELQPAGSVDVGPYGILSWPIVLPPDERSAQAYSDESIGGANTVGFLNATQWNSFDSDPAGYTWGNGFWSSGSGETTGPVLAGSLPVGPGAYWVVFYSRSASPSWVNFSSPLEVSFGPANSTPNNIVTFAESGLPAGSEWSVSIAGGDPLNGTGSDLSTTLANGSYTATATVPGGDWAATSIDFSVNGSQSTEPVSFVHQLYSVAVEESGLSSTQLRRDGWTLVIDGVANHEYSAAGTVQLPNGTYDYLIFGPSGERVSGVSPTGSVANSGGGSLEVQFTRGPTYSLAFHESGLPKAESWCVSVIGWQRCSTGSREVYGNLTPGVYASAVLSKVGQTITATSLGEPVALSSNLSIADRSVALSVKYVYSYSLVFRESGLGAGSPWSVTVRGVTHYSVNGTISFSEPNGSYAYRVGMEDGYSHSGVPSTARIRGAPASVSIQFSLRPAQERLSPSDSERIAALRSLSSWGPLQRTRI